MARVPSYALDIGACWQHHLRALYVYTKMRAPRRAWPGTWHIAQLIVFSQLNSRTENCKKFLEEYMHDSDGFPYVSQLVCQRQVSRE